MAFRHGQSGLVLACSLCLPDGSGSVGQVDASDLCLRTKEGGALRTVAQMRLTMSKAAVRAEAKDQGGRGGEGGLGGIDRVRRFKSQTPLLLVRDTAEELLSQSLRFPHCLVSSLL